MSSKGIYEEGERLPRKICPDCGAKGARDSLGLAQDLGQNWWDVYRCKICGFEMRKRRYLTYAEIQERVIITSAAMKGTERG